MTAPTVAVTIRLSTQDGDPYPDVVITAKANQVDSYQGFIIPDPESVTTDVNGEAVMQCFPNALAPDGLGGTGAYYKFVGKTAAGTTVLKCSAQIPNQDTLLSDVAVMGDPSVDIPPGTPGPQGPVGPQGVPGPALNILGELDSPSDLPAGAPDGDGYLIAGHLWVRASGQWVDAGNIQGPQGIQGVPGNNGTNGTNGTNGAAATIAVGTVTTGAPGSSVVVHNSGSSSAAVFDITIPRGDPGEGSDVALSFEGTSITAALTSLDVRGGGVTWSGDGGAATLVFPAPVTSLAASAITNTPAGNIASTTVQAAINELDNEKQPLDAELTAIAGLTSAADRVPYFTGLGAAALATFTSFGRTMVAWASAAAARAGLGSTTVGDALFTAADAAAGRTTLGATTTGGSLFTAADAAAGRTTLGLGTSATLAVDTDTTLAGDSDTRLPSQHAVKTYVDGKVTGLLKNMGDLDASANPNYPAAAKGDTYVISVAGKVGGASGVAVDIGDMVSARTANAGGTQAAVGTSWFVLEHNLIGALMASNNLSDLSSASTARTNLGVPAGSGTSTGTNTGDQSTITGNAGTATTLQTARTINGISFNGSANITVGVAATDVTGTLAGANGGTGVANTGKTITLGGNLTTSGAFASTFTMTGTTAVTFPTSGTLATRNGAETLGGKRIIPRTTGNTGGGATPAISTDDNDMYFLLGQAVNITNMSTNLSGSPQHGEGFVIQITGTTSITINWGSAFEASTVALPTTTSGTNMLTVAFLYNGATSKWRCVGVA